LIILSAGSVDDSDGGIARQQIPEKSEYPGIVQEIALNKLFGIVVIIYNY